jgi:hypothetical protein
LTSSRTIGSGALFAIEEKRREVAKTTQRRLEPADVKRRRGEDSRELGPVEEIQKNSAKK